MEQTLFAGHTRIPYPSVSKVFITIVQEDGEESYIDVDSINIGHNSGDFNGRLGSISGNGNVSRVIR